MHASASTSTWLSCIRLSLWHPMWSSPDEEREHHIHNTSSSVSLSPHLSNRGKGGLSSNYCEANIAGASTASAPRFSKTFLFTDAKVG